MVRNYTYYVTYYVNYEHHHIEPLLMHSPTMRDFSPWCLHSHLIFLPSTVEQSGYMKMELELLFVIFALSIPSVPVGACLSLPEEVREKRSVPLPDHWSVPVDPADFNALASVLAEVNEAAGHFAGKRAGAATHILVDDESKADRFMGKREADENQIN